MVDTGEHLGWVGHGQKPCWALHWALSKVQFASICCLFSWLIVAIRDQKTEFVVAHLRFHVEYWGWSSGPCPQPFETAFQSTVKLVWHWSRSKFVGRSKAVDSCSSGRWDEIVPRIWSEMQREQKTRICAKTKEPTGNMAMLCHFKWGNNHQRHIHIRYQKWFMLPFIWLLGRTWLIDLFLGLEMVDKCNIGPCGTPSDMVWTYSGLIPQDENAISGQ